LVAVQAGPRIAVEWEERAREIIEAACPAPVRRRRPEGNGAGKSHGMMEKTTGAHRFVA
jgi:hypothetical protein